MANTDRPYGFEPAGRVLSMTMYPKGTATAIYPGDAVIVNSAGNVVVATAGSIELLGAAVGYQAATATEILVYDRPDQRYWIQDDGAAGTLAATNVGNNLDIVVTTGNATYLRSRHEADTSTVQTTTAQLRILDKHPDDAWGKNVRLLVTINEHSTAKKTAGI